MFDSSKYTISIRKSEFEGEWCFEARIAELPDVAEYADSAEEAYDLAIDTIETTAQIMAERGKSMPNPVQVIEEYSGRVTLRLPKSLHRSLAVRAEKEDVSLNSYMTNILSSHEGYLNGLSSSAEGHFWKTGAVKKPMQKSSQLKVVYSKDMQNCA